MVQKVFEQVISFRKVEAPTGPVWLPLIEVELIDSQGNRRAIPMLFDTGASITTMRHGFAPYLGATTWTEGEPVDMATASGCVTGYRFVAQLEVLGKVIECPVVLLQLPPNPLYGGLLGREAIFERFGFGFWESTHELLVTASP